MEWAQARVARRAAHALQADVFADRLYDVDRGFELLDEIHGACGYFENSSCADPGENVVIYGDTLEACWCPLRRLLNRIGWMKRSLRCRTRDAVFLIRAGERSAYLAKTSMLRRRLLRILKPAAPARRSLNLREVATRVEYWLTGSRFESMLVHYALARREHPDDYLRLIKLRMPAYVKLVLANDYPRTQVTRG